LHAGFKGSLRENNMKKITWILEWLAIVIAALTLTAGIAPILAVSADDKPAVGASVKIDNFSFGPADVNIPVGTTVTWTNHDDVPHVVASNEKLFKSKPLDTDDHFSFTFTKPGTYVYYCSIHPKMIAKVVVR
jgi:plastocyanin